MVVLKRIFSLPGGAPIAELGRQKRYDQAGSQQANESTSLRCVMFSFNGSSCHGSAQVGSRETRSCVGRGALGNLVVA
eukprot:m.200293 g.200293  ORF g.200293 m.200293 type:complete len:78 (-) comp17051_c0_seq2:84-317(-)